MEETLTPQYGLSEKEAETFGAFEEASLTTEETDDLVKEFFEEACKDPAVLRSSGDRP